MPRIYFERRRMASVENLALYFVGCDENIIKTRVIQKLSGHKIYRTLSGSLDDHFLLKLYHKYHL